MYEKLMIKVDNLDDKYGNEFWNFLANKADEYYLNPTKENEKYFIELLEENDLTFKEWLILENDCK